MINEMKKWNKDSWISKEFYILFNGTDTTFDKVESLYFDILIFSFIHSIFIFTPIPLPTMKHQLGYVKKKWVWSYFHFDVR